MERMTFFIIVCIAGIIGALVTLIFSQNWACMVAAIIGIPGLALTIETWLRDRREINAKLNAELLERKTTIDDFINKFNLDYKRAELLYLAGFKRIEDFKGKTAEELMAIDEINPTLANRIVRNVEKY
jgi:low affinity Fe/Cu permease